MCKSAVAARCELTEASLVLWVLPSAPGSCLVLPDVLQLWLDSSVLWLRRAAACSVSALMHIWQLCQGSKVNVDPGKRPGGTEEVELNTFLLLSDTGDKSVSFVSACFSDTSVSI